MKLADMEAKHGEKKTYIIQSSKEISMHLNEHAGYIILKLEAAISSEMRLRPFFSQLPPILPVTIVTFVVGHHVVKHRTPTTMF